MNMKTLALCICSITLAVTASAQPPPPPPAGTSPEPTASVTASVSSGSNLANRLHQKLDKKFRGRHGIVLDADKDGDDLAKLCKVGEALAISSRSFAFMSIFGAL